METTTSPDIFDENGTNATASFMLNDDHDVLPVSDFGDDIADHCGHCGFAAGWVQPTVLGPDEWGHATAMSSDEVLDWIVRLGQLDRPPALRDRVSP